MKLRPVRLLKEVPKLDYFRFHKLCFALSIALCLLSVVSIATKGFNFGVDFAGGILIEVKAPGGKANLAEMRSKLLDLGGDIALQEFGSPNEILIRAEQPPEGGERAVQEKVSAIQAALGPGYDYRRIEVVGPKVGGELIRQGIWAVTLSLGGILVYMAFRFGWRAGLAGVVAILHDCLTTVGLFSLTGMQFDLTVLSAVVTIAGISINDTVVIDDRIRENTRKYKAMDFRRLINLSVNETMSRTIVTNGLVFLTVLALVTMGGPVLWGFSVALLWGTIVGTYSTIYVAAPLEWYLANRGKAHHKKEVAAPGEAAPERP